MPVCRDFVTIEIKSILYYCNGLYITATETLIHFYKFFIFLEIFFPIQLRKKYFSMVVF
jgi:hypothetical protein